MLIHIDLSHQAVGILKSTAYRFKSQVYCACNRHFRTLTTFLKLNLLRVLLQVLTEIFFLCIGKTGIFSGERWIDHNIIIKDQIVS